jgi:hypothetical protein
VVIPVFSLQKEGVFTRLTVMERRAFVRLSAYTALALTLPFADGCKSNPNDAPWSQPLLFSHIVDVKTINEAGKAYRKMVSNEDDKGKLTMLLTAQNTITSKNTIQSSLDNRVKEDFKTGKTVTVSGWVLSVTEARQCALFSILNA